MNIQSSFGCSERTNPRRFCWRISESGVDCRSIAESGAFVGGIGGGLSNDSGAVPVRQTPDAPPWGALSGGPFRCTMHIMSNTTDWPECPDSVIVLAQVRSQMLAALGTFRLKSE